MFRTSRRFGPKAKGFTLTATRTRQNLHDFSSPWFRQSGPEKGLPAERGLFTGGISRISHISCFSGISKIVLHSVESEEWSDSALGAPRMWGLPPISSVSGGSPPPSPHCNWRTLSSLKPNRPSLKSPLLPSSPPPLGSFCEAPGGGGPGTGWGGGVLLGRKGVEEGGLQDGTWGQTHIWGY